MTWNPKKRGAAVETPVLEEPTVSELLDTLTATVTKLLAINERSAAIRAIAEPLELPVGDCELPGCGRAFLKVPENRRFCIPSHKIEYNNKHRR